MEYEPRLPPWPQFDPDYSLPPSAANIELPESLSVEEAFRAAYYMIEGYMFLEKDPDEGLINFMQYMRSDPARWSDWKKSVRRAVTDGGAASGYMREELGGIEL